MLAVSDTCDTGARTSRVRDTPAVLPKSFRVLQHDTPLVIPGFVQRVDPTARVFAPEPLRSDVWFAEFVDRLSDACGKTYLPVMRMSDGEYLFCVGPQPPVPWTPLGPRMRGVVKHWLGSLSRSDFVAGASGVYSSGKYTRQEMADQRRRYAELTARVARDGILAPHLSYGRVPFQEKFFPAMKAWLATQGIVLTRANYAPFYFVYAALAGEGRKRLIAGKRVLLVTNADADKRARVEASLTAQGATAIRWCPISASRSLFDELDLDALHGTSDIAFVAAGIGKPNVLTQLAPLQIPCVDVGYMLEVWANPAVADARPYCTPDAP